MLIKQVPCHSDHVGGSRSRPPTHIVLHLMDGSLAGTDSWFAMSLQERLKRQPTAGKSSAHYGVGKTGEVHQYVPDDVIAYHAGGVDHPTVELLPGNPNWYSIGIEHEGKAADELPLELYVASARLLRMLSAKHGIPLDTNHVWLHREIYSRKTCPGKLNRDLLLAMAAHIEP